MKKLEPDTLRTERKQYEIDQIHTEGTPTSGPGVRRGWWAI